QLDEDEALDGLVARLAAAAGEDDLVGLGAEEVGDLLAGAVDGVMGSLAVGVAAGRVAELLAQVRQHGVEDGGVEGRRRIVVEVNRFHVSCPTVQSRLIRSPRRMTYGYVANRGRLRRRHPETAPRAALARGAASHDHDPS